MGGKCCCDNQRDDSVEIQREARINVLTLEKEEQPVEEQTTVVENLFMKGVKFVKEKHVEEEDDPNCVENFENHEKINFFPIRSFKVYDIYTNKVGGRFNYEKYGIVKDTSVPDVGPYKFNESGNIYEG